MFALISSRSGSQSAMITQVSVTGPSWPSFFFFFLFIYCISESMLATLIQRYDKKSFYFKKERLTEILQAARCHILYLY